MRQAVKRVECRDRRIGRGDGRVMVGCLCYYCLSGTRRGFVGRSSLPPASGESTSLNLDRWTTLFPPSIPLTNYRLVEHGIVLLIALLVSLIMYAQKSIINWHKTKFNIPSHLPQLSRMIKVVLPQQPPAYRWRRRSSATELGCLRHGQHSIIRSPAGGDGTSLREISPHSTTLWPPSL
jgi:hypothetical protein